MLSMDVLVDLKYGKYGSCSTRIRA